MPDNDLVTQLATIAQAVETLKAEATVTRQLIAETTARLEQQAKDDKTQTQEIRHVKKVSLLAMAVVCVFTLSGQNAERLGEENIARILELVGLTLGVGSIVATPINKADE